MAAFQAAARKAKLTLVGSKTGFLIQGEDRLGAGAELIAKLAEAKINVTACDAVAAGEGRKGDTARSSIIVKIQANFDKTICACFAIAALNYTIQTPNGQHRQRRCDGGCY